MAVNTNPFQFVGNALESATNTFVVDAVNRLVHTITPWALASVTLYLTLYGYLVMMGMIREPAKEGLLKAGKIVIISALALNADTYLTWIMGTLQGMQVSITAALTGDEGVTIYQILDGALNRGLALIAQCTKNAADAGWTEMGTMINWYIVAGAMTLSFGMVAVTGGIAILMAIVLLRFLFAIGPICILCLIHPVTAGHFKDWFGQAVTFILQIALAAAVIAFSIVVFDQAVTYLDLRAVAPNSDQNAVIGGLVMLVVGLVLQAVVGGTAIVAGKVGGGISSGVMRATDAVRTAIAPMRTARNLVNPTSTRLNPRTGYPTTASRLEHIAMGRTVAAPAYRQVVLEHMRNGWKKPSGGTIQRD